MEYNYHIRGGETKKYGLSDHWKARIYNKTGKMQKLFLIQLTMNGNYEANFQIVHTVCFQSCPVLSSIYDCYLSQFLLPKHMPFQGAL